MKIVMFWSYKGGSGRTVAAANSAAALAKLGKKTAIIDLDFEAPGLHHLYGVEQTPQYQGGHGIQHYLRGDINIDELESNVMIDLFGGPLRRFEPQVRQPGKLLFIMSSDQVIQISPQQDPKIAPRLQQLLQLLSNKYGIEYLILDATSGVRSAYTLALDVSHDVLMLFRWSIQHVEGTLTMIKAVAMMRDYGQKYVPTRVVASAVPGAHEIQQLEDENLRQVLLLSRQEARARVDRELERYQMASPTVFHEIPEMLEMKWREGVAVFGRQTSPYEELVQKLLQVHAAA